MDSRLDICIITAEGQTVCQYTGTADEAERIETIALAEAVPMPEDKADGAGQWSR